MPHFALAIGSDDHPRKERRAIDVILQVEHDGGGAVLAVAGMVGTGVVVAVGNRALVDVEREELRALRDGLVHFLILHAALGGQHHRQMANEARLVERPITAERAMILPVVVLGPGHPVAPGADGALAAGDRVGVGLDRRQDIPVAGEEAVFR